MWPWGSGGISFLSVAVLMLDIQGPRLNVGVLCFWEVSNGVCRPRPGFLLDNPVRERGGSWDDGFGSLVAWLLGWHGRDTRTRPRQMRFACQGPRHDVFPEMTRLARDLRQRGGVRVSVVL
ncbi:uncharacterized protein IWZ02DRAFT_440473 [Phyllosticta citriasiana]|uniref:uncharacterized protein n=1 Tax=Phyllosticta citriasiana TaxID=595635 RepID=UPI0030FD5E54